MPVSNEPTERRTKAMHSPDCAINDLNPDGIVKPCNCGQSRSEGALRKSAGPAKAGAAVPTGSSPVLSAKILKLVERWDAEAAEYQQNFNVLTCGARSVGRLEAHIALLKKHVKELRRLVASTTVRQPGSNVPDQPRPTEHK